MQWERYKKTGSDESYEDWARRSPEPGLGGWWYHHAPTDQRNRILQHGLQVSQPGFDDRWGYPDKFMEENGGPWQPPGVYLINDPTVLMKSTYGGDVWRVPHSDIQSYQADPLVSDSIVVPHTLHPELWRKQEDDLPTWQQDEEPDRGTSPRWRLVDRGLVKGNPWSERFEQWGIGQPTTAAVADWPMQPNLDWSPVGHQLRYNPGEHAFKYVTPAGGKQWLQEPGRGILTPDQTLHTWVESGPTHNEMIRHLGYPDQWRGEQTPVQFHINPEGRIRISDPGFMNTTADPWIERQIAQYDPRLVPTELTPDRMEAYGDRLNPETGEWNLSKVADWYHVAPTVDRARIQEHGLQMSDPTYNWAEPEIWEEEIGQTPPEGVYAWPQLEQAQQYAPILTKQRGTSHDIWRIPETPDLEGRPDPDLSRGFYHPEQFPYYFTHPSGRIIPELHEGPEDKPWPHEKKHDQPYLDEMWDYDEQHIQGNPWGIGQPVTAATDSKPYEAKMWASRPDQRGKLGPIRAPFWATSHQPEALGLAGGEGSEGYVHPVQVRFNRPAYYLANVNWTPDSIDEARTQGCDGCVVHWPADERDPSDPIPARTWAIALDPGAVTPGHLKDNVWE